MVGIALIGRFDNCVLFIVDNIGVVTGTAGKGVGTAAAVEMVVTGTAADGVVSCAAVNIIVGVIAGQYVGVFGTDQVFNLGAVTDKGLTFGVGIQRNGSAAVAGE